MIKNSSINRIIRMTLLLFVLFLLYFFPNAKNEYSLKTMSTSSNNYHDIYLIDKNNYVAKTTISVKSIEKEKLAQDLLESLIINSRNKSKIPSGFKASIPENTKIQKVKVMNEYITVSLSSEVLKTSHKERMIESIVYTLTSISNIKHVNILINEKENDFFKNDYTRNIGINKKVDITSLNDISSVTLYYVNKENSVNYYIPVTKYINSNEDKVKIIIDELSSKSSYESNLMSYLNYETKLMSYTLDDKDLNLYFNDAILNSKEDNKILEEVIYSISYSIKDTIEVSNIHFFVNDKEI